MDEVKVTLQELGPVRRRIEVEVPAPRVQAELDRSFQTLGRQARLPGFRPGRAPRAVLERMFGEQVRRDVLAKLVEESFLQVVERYELRVVGSPDIDAEPLNPGQALRFSATVDVRPAIAPPSLDGLEAGRPSTVVTDAEIDRVLHSLRDSVASLRPIEDRNVVEAGDVVTIDVTSRLDGGAPQKREGVLIDAGGGSFPLALERQLVGQHRGARLDLTVPYPQDHSNPNLAGKTVAFEVEIKDLRRKELPPLDDDFARDHGRCESLEDLRSKVRHDLERQAVRRADQHAREAIIDQLIARTAFEVPPSLVERRSDTLLAGLGVRIPEGPDGTQLLDQLRQGVRPRAEREVRADLILESIAGQLGVDVTAEEVAHEIDAIAAHEKEVPERIRALYERPEAHAALRARMVRERALDQVIARAKIVPSEGSDDVARA